MKTVLMTALGCLHLAALVGLIVWYARRRRITWQEMPLLAFLLLWSALIAGGYIASLFDALDSLPAYIVASFAGLGLVLGLHRAAYAPPEKTPYANAVLPDFVLISDPRLRRALAVFLCATLALAFLVHLTIAASFYPCNGDSMIYRLPRAFWYVTQGNILHPFVSFDKRITFYPLNGVMLYLPLVLYRLPGQFHYLPSLFCWLAVVYASYRFPRALGAERLIALFAAWLVALTPSILVQATSTNDEILAAAAMLAGLYFAWRWLATGSGHYLFMAALGIGVSAGTKPHMVYLAPLTGFALVWFAVFLLKRHQSWTQWIPRTTARTWIVSFAALVPLATLFMLVNYLSEGRFFYFGEYGPEVFNLDGFGHLMAQNLILFFTQMILAPIATLDVFLSPHARIAYEEGLNNFFSPLVASFMSNDPRFYHIHYRFQGVVIPTTILLVEFSLWPGFAYLLWPLQWIALARRKFTLRPLFILLAVVPVVWLITWSCVMLYMEGVPTYLAFFLIVAAPAMAFCFLSTPSLRANRLRWALIGFVALTQIAINANVAVNNIFRGFRELADSPTWPDDWLRFEQPAIGEIRRASDIQVLALHTLTYFFSFMHWNPDARYYTPYSRPQLPADRLAHLLQITSVASEYKFGLLPLWIPDKPSPGMTYLGNIRGADTEAIMAVGNGVAQRWPGRSNYILIVIKTIPAGDHYEIGFQGEVGGLNPGDNLEFSYQVKTADGKVIYNRPWSADPHFIADVPSDPVKVPYTVAVAVRNAQGKIEAQANYPVDAKNAWHITGFEKGTATAPALWPSTTPTLVSVHWP